MALSRVETILMKKRLTLILFSLQMTCTSYTFALPTGAPVRACDTLTPPHGIKLGTQSESPFTINITKMASGDYEVTIEGSETFQGFILQARDKDNTPAGTLALQASSADLGRVLICRGSGNTLTHTDTQQKTSIKAVWTPPAGFDGPVKIHATVMPNYSGYYELKQIASE